MEGMGAGKENVDLSVEISGLSMTNPTMLASGIWGVTIPVLKRVYEGGAGAVVTKSVSLEPKEGYANPTVVEVVGGFVNAIGLSNPGVEEFAEELSSSDMDDCPVVVSMFGSTPSDFGKMAEILAMTSSRAFELNLSCPHVSKVGIEVGEDPEVVAEIVKATKSKGSKPVIAKLSPTSSFTLDVAKAAEEAGADAITLGNTARALAIDVETGRPVLSNKFGGLSGPCLKPIALARVYELFRDLEIPIIGCGGISSPEDALEYILGGASAVQIGTVLTYKGLTVFKEVSEGIRTYLARKGKRGIREIVGLSHRY